MEHEGPRHLQRGARVPSLGTVVLHSAPGHFLTGADGATWIGPLRLACCAVPWPLTTLSRRRCSTRITSLWTASLSLTQSSQTSRSGSTVVPLWKGACCSAKGSSWPSIWSRRAGMPAAAARLHGVFLSWSSRATSCPVASTFFAISSRLYSRHQCRCVRPWRSPDSRRRLPPLMRMSNSSTKLYSMQRISGVSPFLSFAVGEAPRLSSVLTIGRLRWAMTQCSAVWPCTCFGCPAISNTSYSSHSLTKDAMSRPCSRAVSMSTFATSPLPEATAR
mmetsp:Transcript_52632/g.162005  ORF Transcript_52632/g.162005 Transcript_52632/m.162005 type:complete len:276 (-) Transcript_52632:297-1124(-)